MGDLTGTEQKVAIPASVSDAGPAPLLPQPTSPQGEVRRFLLGLATLAAFFGLMMLLLRVAFLVVNWKHLHAAGASPIARGFFIGLRFDAAMVAIVLAPVMVLLLAAVTSPRRRGRRVVLAYLALLVFLLPLIYSADLHYFDETSSHFSGEVLAHCGTMAWPVIKGALKLHPWATLLPLLAIVALTLGCLWWLRRLLRWMLPPEGRRRPGFLLASPLMVVIAIIAIRGGFGPHPLSIGASRFSSDLYLNALSLNPLYAVFHSAVEGDGQQYDYFTEAHNVAVVRQLLGCDQATPLDERYPLLRQSPGIAGGNRRNVVIFFLESWSGKDIGCLGGDPRATPVFDSLAQGGLLFTNFYATGIRTPEGIFTTLCSFPNQPLRPISNRSATFQDRWRPLSQILAEVGYQTLFIHGRDLDFDHMRAMLTSLHFDKLIDRNSFPPSVSPQGDDSWPGYSDEEVMKRADAEFAAAGDQPFLGCIYTMNTHPPFVTPAGFPRLYPPTSASNSFLNALSYSDYTLKVFFDLARRRPYFKNTLFLFVADHARTRDRFDYDSQHRIPFVVYAPGLVSPAVHPEVSGQLDIMPTVLGLLDLKTMHASWGRDLLAGSGSDNDYAVSAVGDEVRWHTRRWLLVDSPGGSRPLLFDLLADPHCKQNLWGKAAGEPGKALRETQRAYLTLSQQLLYSDRNTPPAVPHKPPQ